MLPNNMRAPDQSSPKSSPRGSRSPAILPYENSTGTLKTKITLIGKNPSIVPSGPFYLMKELPERDHLTGSTNLINHYGLEHSFNKFSGKKVKEELSAFLPHLPGNIDTQASTDNSSLRALIEKPPICGKEVLQFSATQLSGFRLHPGPLPEKYRQTLQATPLRKKKKKEKHKERDEVTVTSGGSAGSVDSSTSSTNRLSIGNSTSNSSNSTSALPPLAPASNTVVTPSSTGSSINMPPTPDAASITGATLTSQTSSDMNTSYEKKHKKLKPREDSEEKKKRKKKEKKRKKEKHHSPDPSSDNGRDKFG